MGLWTLDHCLKVALSKGPERVGVSLPSAEDGNRSSFQNIVFSKFQTIDKVHKPRDSGRQYYLFQTSASYIGADRKWNTN
jgi:hypothetical protein